MVSTPASSPLPPLAPDAYEIGADEATLEHMRRDFAALGDTYRVTSPSRGTEAWVIHDPDDVKRVLLSNHRNYTKGLGLDRVKILLGNGIMVSEGALWRRQRRMMQPLFHRRVIQGFAAVIDEANERMLGRWSRLAGSREPVDVTDETSELALDIILRALFGRDLEWLSARMGGNPFALVTEMPERNLQFAYRFRSLTRLVSELMARRRDGQEEHFDYLGMLMAAQDRETGASMDERELVDEVLTLVVAGHETTAASLNMTWYLLSQHPDAEARLHAEVDARPEGTMTYQDAEEMTWTQCVLKEAMRLYPPGWLLTRRPIEPDRLGGYDVPAGTDVLLSPYFVHRHPGHWDDPESFHPDRFGEEPAGLRHKFAYFPFAAGPRHCIGENFAMFEMTVHLARVARRFRLHYLDEGPIEFEAQVNLRTRNNLRYRLEPR
jgi:cytochrome P450